ncbi:hypothetical protein O181_011172 [Austropuccinia psidii MF-1]|uniref:Uncharacterized protein n=1 Tax=Austropuccinia psidii MF-1 TaxID=1389203 RepID=A0A9Q3BU09_9BASI|nr:hypothetical protein [Austropuccinia psidii MF-1]
MSRASAPERYKILKIQESLRNRYHLNLRPETQVILAQAQATRYYRCHLSIIVIEDYFQFGSDKNDIKMLHNMCSTATLHLYKTQRANANAASGGP